MEVATLFDDELAGLPEYSCSVPTSVTIGKRWKRDQNFGLSTTEKFWYVGEYVECEQPQMADIRWQRVETVLSRAEWADLEDKPTVWRVYVEVYELPHYSRDDATTCHITGKRLWVPLWVEDLCMAVNFSMNYVRLRLLFRAAAKFQEACGAAHRLGGITAVTALIVKDVDSEAIAQA